jgi:hypothetical protein
MNLAALRTDAPGRLADLERGVRDLPEVQPERRRITLVLVGPGPAGVDPAAIGPAPVKLDVVRVEGAPGPAQVVEVRDAIASSAGDLVAVMLTTTTAPDPSWLSRLSAPVADAVVASAPLLVHPARARGSAGPHDGRVRSAGLEIELADDGAPVVLSVLAGSTPAPMTAQFEVFGASAACFVVDRGAYDAAGGLPAGPDLEIAVVELCARLRASGGRIVAAPSAVLLDHRPVSSWRALRRPIDPDGVAWRAAVDRCGPDLLRAARPGGGGALRFVITVAAPSAKVATRWGDWHLAEGLAAALRREGCETRVEPLDRTEDLAGRSYDVRVVLRGLAPVRASAGQRHVLWIISHPESVGDEELDAADLVLVASPRFADHLRSRTATPVDVLLQATDPERFHPIPVDPGTPRPVTVVAKTRDVLRPIVADAIAVGLRPAIYGGGWRDFVDPALIVADHVDNEQLPVVYSTASVVLNDHWETMREWGFVSNRIYDVLACGTPVISDPTPGLADLFDGAALEYHDPHELGELVADVLADQDGARSRAERGRGIILSRHTYDDRARELLEALDRHR